MTKKELEQLNDLKKEIEEIEQSILKINQMDIHAAPVRVNSSNAQFPYTQTKISVQECDPVLANRQATLLYAKRKLLIDRKEKAAAEERKLIQYINSIGESRIRRIMHLRYAEGLTWEKIGDLMNCDRTTAEKTVARYLKQDNKSR